MNLSQIQVRNDTKVKVLSFDVSPFNISIEVFGIFNCFDKNSIRALFAFPSIGCAVSLTFTPVSSFKIAFLLAFGEIFKFNIRHNPYV